MKTYILKTTVVQEDGKSITTTLYVGKNWFAFKFAYWMAKLNGLNAFVSTKGWSKEALDEVYPDGEQS